MFSFSQVNVFFLFVALATVFRTTRSKAQRSRGVSKYKGYGELFKYVAVVYVHLPQYIISNTLHWMRAVGHIQTCAALVTQSQAILALVDDHTCAVLA